MGASKNQGPSYRPQNSKAIISKGIQERDTQFIDTAMLGCSGDLASWLSNGPFGTYSGLLWVGAYMG